MKEVDQEMSIHMDSDQHPPWGIHTSGILVTPHGITYRFRIRWRQIWLGPAAPILALHLVLILICQIYADHLPEGIHR